jgi:hypothetical protein
MTLNKKSEVLAALGRQEQALVPIEQSVSINRQLSKTSPDAFLPHLAKSLQTLANVLNALGRDAEAMKVQAEADTIRG